MLNAGMRIDDSVLDVVDYANAEVAKALANGQVNTAEDGILANIAASIRRQHPQIRPFAAKHERICLVGSGPSLADTEEELRELVYEGARVVTMNGAYHWCNERNIQPGTQIIMDARPGNARFLAPYVPQCRYLLASQCDPACWDAVADYPDVWIFHGVMAAGGPVIDLLDAFYQGQWFGVGGGVTVATRSVMALSMCGYRRFDLFGVDCCWLAGRHHAFEQPENAGDKYLRVVMDNGTPGSARTFRTSPWMLKQAEDFMQLIRVNGEEFKLAVHGRGLLAYALELNGTGQATSLDVEVEAPPHA